jgi:predicted transcriptional regulator
MANTLTISFDSETSEQLQQAAEWIGVDVTQAAEQAVIEYVRRCGREKIEREMQAFEQLRAQLLTQYRGQYVAIHQGQVVAHAPDLRSLHAQVFARFGQTPILHKLVSDEPEPVIKTHGLRLAGGAR